MFSMPSLHPYQTIVRFYLPMIAAREHREASNSRTIGLGFSVSIDGPKCVEPTKHVEPYKILFHKLRATDKRLVTWCLGFFSNNKVLLNAVLLVMLRFDIAQE
jgi:hypothetical protein